jgi:hypothetical protein
MGAELMLRFEVPPDKVFLAILHAALALQKDYVEMLMETEDGPASRWWPVTEPLLARFFDPPTAVHLIGRLLAASRERQVYQLTDYHWLMIYRCLETFCDLHNDEAGTDPSGRTEVGPYSLGPIDFDAIVDRFFWDTDFLIGPELLNLSPDQRARQLGFSDEAFSIAAGLAPHASEIEIRPWGHDDDRAWHVEDERFPPDGIIAAYPPQDPDGGDEDPE